MRSPFLRGLLCFALAARVALMAAPTSGEVAFSCDTVPELIDRMLEGHIRFRSLTEELKTRTVDNYLEWLDPSKSLFLEKEAEHARRSLRSIFSEVERGDCKRFPKVQQDSVARAREAERFVREFVGNPSYAIDQTVEIVTDPDKRGFPKTPEERSAFQKKLLHLQIASYLSSDLSLEEAKQRLIHRYELLTKQALEQKPEDLLSAFVDAFAHGLDPHSGYLSPEAEEDFRIDMGLSLEGIGLRLSSPDGYPLVEEVIPGGAADRHKGIKPKDKIIAVTQEGGEPENVVDMPLRDVVRLIRGKKGTPVTLTILRQGEKTERFSVVIIRDKINLEEQAAKLRFESFEHKGRKLRLAVLNLPSFYGDMDRTKRQSLRDVERLLAQVRTEKADGLLLDLSRNGGGLLEHAVTISGLFLRSGGIVAVQNSHAETQVLSDPDRSLAYTGPLVVLTSRITASASEILAGALKDYRRALIVGDDHTFGKGTVQTLLHLPEGLGSLKLTTALFFRPAGASTQHTGVVADVSVPSVLSGTDEIGERQAPYSLPAQSIPPFVGRDANGIDETTRWRPLTNDLVKQLAERSQARISKNEEFSELEVEIKKTAQQRELVRVADILQESEKSTQDGSPPKAEDEEKSDELTLQAREALAILADLVTLGGADSKEAVAQRIGSVPGAAIPH